MRDQDITAVQKLVVGLDMPTLEPAQWKELHLAVTRNEILEVIKTLLKCQASGPDVFPLKFYATSFVMLAERLLEVYNEEGKRGTFPRPCRKHDLETLSSYCPLCMINVGVKVLVQHLQAELRDWGLRDTGGIHQAYSASVHG
ncbi:hypothetical protein NDU88_006815 [Pleurodeles waltl]|uniref:Uncharacterized protein n=1 Tax=Pleurodeles waltl TaxID=8319 RepID=A0AAV7SQL3_PLEWA|nr:hypothetical protein NDU88_006815 [Pleurodeles waltl]